MNADEAAAERRKARTFKKFSYRGVEVRRAPPSCPTAGLCAAAGRSLARAPGIKRGQGTDDKASTTHSLPSCSTSTRRRSPSSFTRARVADSSAA